MKHEYDEPEDLEPHEAQETTEDEAQEEMAEKLQMFGYGLKRLAEEQIGIRQQVEERWLADLEQYMGQYDAETKARLNKTNGSQAFVNITRAKTTAAEARLTDMLFPSDDKNWGIQPTPVPQLQKASTDTTPIDVDEQGNPITKADIAKEQIKIAREKADAMAKEIDDQLTEAKYHQMARDIIHDACLFGTGVLKGPIVINRTRKQWELVSNSVHRLNITNDFRPGVERVKIWDYFPDMSATNKDDCSFEFERRYITKKQLIELSKRPGYLKDQIRKVIAQSPTPLRGNGGSYIARIRELSGISANIDDNRYELWEYHGSANKENLAACGVEVDDDELMEVDCVVAFINDIVIKADLNPLETNESIYSIFCYEDDDTSVFGLGIPHLLRNEQKIVNAAWRMTLDNAALSTGPQIIVNRETVEPSDGSWDMKSKKIWWLNDPDKDVRAAMAAFEIPSHQSELTQIFEIARDMADDVTNLPMLAQGEQGDSPDTATGMSMLMNSANVVLRRVVKQFDDGITKPFITRMYDWNMQNSDKEEIKGDFEVDARGSTALLVKETQTKALQDLLVLAEKPIYAELTKHADLYRKAVEAQHISPDDIVKTNEEIESEKNQPNLEAQAQQQIMMAQLAEIRAKVDKLKSDKANVDADTTDKKVTGMFSAISAGEKIALVPGIAPIADEIYQSAGGTDANGYPIAQGPQQSINVQDPMQQNTSPNFPPHPDVGVNKGIETGQA